MGMCARREVHGDVCAEGGAWGCVRGGRCMGMCARTEEGQGCAIHGNALCMHAPTSRRSHTGVGKAYNGHHSGVTSEEREHAPINHSPAPPRRPSPPSSPSTASSRRPPTTMICSPSLTPSPRSCWPTFPTGPSPRCSSPRSASSECALIPVVFCQYDVLRAALLPCPAPDLALPLHLTLHPHIHTSTHPH